MVFDQGNGPHYYFYRFSKKFLGFQGVMKGKFKIGSKNLLKRFGCIFKTIHNTVRYGDLWWNVLNIKMVFFLTFL